MFGAHQCHAPHEHGPLVTSQPPELEDFEEFESQMLTSGEIDAEVDDEPGTIRAWIEPWDATIVRLNDMLSEDGGFRDPKLKHVDWVAWRGTLRRVVDSLLEHAEIEEDARVVGGGRRVLPARRLSSTKRRWLVGWEQQLRDGADRLAQALAIADKADPRSCGACGAALDDANDNWTCGEQCFRVWCENAGGTAG